jgi:hypothetical protein
MLMPGLTRFGWVDQQKKKGPARNARKKILDIIKCGYEGSENESSNISKLILLAMERRAY